MNLLGILAFGYVSFVCCRSSAFKSEHTLSLLPACGDVCHA